MSSEIQRHLPTGVPAKGTDGTLHSAASGNTAAPSGIEQDGTFWANGVMWAHLDVTVATASSEFTAYAYNKNDATWYVLTSFGVNGVLTVPVGSYRYNLACLGAEHIHVRITGIGASATVTVKASLSQENRR